MSGQRIKEVYLHTNRNTLIYDENGEQIPEYQEAISCYKVNPEIARIVSNSGAKFFISKYREWAHEISRKEFEYLLGLRTLEIDLAENKAGESTHGPT